MHNQSTTPFKNSKLIYENSSVIRSLSPGKFELIENGEELVLDEKDKPCFANEETGEAVIEFTGLATDRREDRSWAKAFYKENGFSPLHYHNERTERYYIITGKAKVLVDEREHILSPGQFIEITPKQKHQVFSIGEEKLVMMVKCSPSWVFNDQHLVEENLTKTLDI